MRVLHGGARPWPLVSGAVVIGALGMLFLPAFAGVPVVVGAVLAAFAILMAVYYRTVLRWRSLLALMLLVILFIPIRRYVLPGNLPFQLEPYRILVALLFAAWLTSMLIDPRVRFRRTGLEGPLLLFLATALASVLVNSSRITPGAVDSSVIKSFSFLLSFVFVVYMFVSLIRRESDIRFLLKVLVFGGAVVASLAVIESRTHFNAFDHLHSVLPFLKQNGQSGGSLLRIGRFRAIGPAEHPIALSAALAMLAPLAGYFAYTERKKRWWLAMGIIVLGCLATVSRTGVLMLLSEALVFAILRPRQMKRAWPAIVPLLAVIHIALPGTLGTLRSSFFPQGGLLQEQQGYKGTGRFGAARLDPTFAQVKSAPLLGIGFGTRITGNTPGENALTLDDQWLDTVLETGIVGAFAWMWLIVRVVRQLGGAARRDLSQRGWLFAALAASLVGYGVSMITYDAFSFVQVTFFFYIALAFASCLLGLPGVEPAREASRRQRPELAAGALGYGLFVLAGALVLFVFFQGPSVNFLILVLVLLLLGASALEKARSARAAPA